MARKFNGPLLLLGAFVGLSALAGAQLLEPTPAPPMANVAQTEEAEDSTTPSPLTQDAASEVANAHDSPFVIKRILPINGPIKYGEWHWDDEGVPDGPIVITVDLDARVLSIFRDGHEIGAAAVLLGTEEKPTPTGIFPIMQKKRHHVSNLYDAEMPYMQRLTHDGVALHASEVEWGYASHGCIGMPEPFAAKVYSQTRVGDRVFITRGKMVGVGDSLVAS